MVQVYVSADLRRLVRLRAREACEYCCLPEAYSFFSHEVDHIMAVKHGGETSEANLALACCVCNKHKGTDLTSIDPETGEIAMLYHPRQHAWIDHFDCIEARIIPLTAIGRASVRLLQFNSSERIAERRLLLNAGLLMVPQRP